MTNDLMGYRTKNERQASAAIVDVDSTVASLGARIRVFRSDQKLSLQALGKKTGLSSSMLSLVERGKASPSIGALVAIASALDVHVGRLFEDRPRLHNAVVPLRDQPVLMTRDGVRRRIVRVDDERGIELMVDEYEPGASGDTSAVHHAGFEYGIVLKGRLVIAVNDEVYELDQGDSIAYDSDFPHRIANRGRRSGTAVWVNLKNSKPAS